MKRISKIIAAIALVAGITLLPTATFAQSSDVTQVINPGVLSSAILNSSGSVVASPVFGMSATNFSFNCQTSTGTLGTDSQRLYIINPSATNGVNTWALQLSASGSWTSGANSYAYNNPAGSGCTGGQLTVNPGVGTVVDDCTSTACQNAVITQGSSTAMSGTTPVTLMNSAASDTVYRGYITGVGLSQAIPAEQPAGSYSLDVTLTAVIQ